MSTSTALVKQDGDWWIGCTLLPQAHAALLAPEPFLWPVEVLMGPSAGTRGHALERLLGLIVPG